MPAFVPENSPQLDIFAYVEYRAFLCDFFAVKKSLNRHYSHRLFAQKAGVRSSGYISEILAGKRRLPAAQAAAFARAMELGPREEAYFHLLVAYGRARSDAARKAVYTRMLEAMPVRLQRLKQSQSEYFAKWYHVAMREALSIAVITGDGSELGALLNPPITAAQARAGLQTLARLDLISRDGLGRWNATQASVLSPQTPESGFLLREFQREMMARAAEALERVPQPERDISCISMSVSPQGLLGIKSLAEEFHRKVLEVVRADRGEDRVMQLNVQFFPLTAPRAPGGGK